MALFDETSKRRTEGRGITALVVETLGVVGIVAYTFLGPRDLRGLDIVMLFVVVSFAAYGTMRTIIRGLMSGVAVYLATGMAASFYPVLTPYSRSFLNVLGTIGLSAPPGGEVDYSALALSFAVLAVLLWGVLELLFRASFENTHVSFLGLMDRVGGAVVYLVIGILVATLAFNTIGYGMAGRPAHDRASLRPEFNRVLELYYQGQSFWFPGRPPAIYVYDLDTS
ncbi:MAG: CvpA family protein [Chloroflexota bacterium]|nr:CvpA family protein [Chloroflexota bacterium]